jgi:hypothetical protein
VSRQRRFYENKIAMLGDDDDDDDDDGDDNDGDDGDEADDSSVAAATAPTVTSATGSATPAHTEPTSRAPSPPPPPANQRALPPTPPSEVPSGAPAPSMSSDSATSSTAPTLPTQPTTAPASSPLPTPLSTYIEAAKPVADNEIAKIVSAQQADPSLDIYRAAIAGAIVPAEVHALRPCVDRNGIVFVRDQANPASTLVAVPTSLREHFCQIAHSGLDGGHHGVKSSIATSKAYAWWPTQAADVGNTARKCLHCASTRSAPLNKEMGRPPTNVRRFESVYLDHVPMPPCDGHNGFYAFTDAATGYTWVHVAADKTAASACAALQWYLATFDNPATVHVDGGSDLNSAAVKALAQQHGFTIVANSPYNHQSHGMVESKLGPIKRQIVHLSAGLNAKSNWVRALPGALRSLNVARSSSRNASPFELMFGAKPNYALMRRIGMLINEAEAPVPDAPEKRVTFADELGARIAVDVERANYARSQRQAANAAQQTRHGTARDINVGDFVFVANLEGTEETAIENKQRQGGPYEVTSIDATLRRATLKRCADNTTLTTPVTFNRLQRVDRETVLTPIAPGSEPGAVAWAGVRDTSLLLPTEKAAADKALAKQKALADKARAAEQAAAEAAEQQRVEKIARDDRRRKFDAAEKQHRRAERDRIAAATRQREQLELDHATVNIPAGGGADRHTASRWRQARHTHHRHERSTQHVEVARHQHCASTIQRV